MNHRNLSHQLYCRAFLQLFSVVIILTILSFFNSCQVVRYVIYNFADIKDYKKFPSRTVHNDSVKFSFLAAKYGLAPKTITDYKTNKKYTFENYLKSDKTVAFIIIKNDSIQYENYFAGYDQKSIVPSFSVAKSILSILIGCAIDDGLIKSVDEPITNYLPELRKNGLQKITIKHLLQMTSGINCTESYINPFGVVAGLYYGRNLKKNVSRMKLKSEPGKEFEYLSVNAQVLGLVLETALKTKTVSEYFQEKLWQPLGMEYDATWSLDKKKNGMEKTFCCINACARDFAKIGRLYLNKGKWNGKQIVSENWVKESTKIDTTGNNVGFYHYLWWLPSKNGDFMASGHLGEYIYVNPFKNLIIVRLGKDQGKIDWWNFFLLLASEY